MNHKLWSYLDEIFKTERQVPNYTYAFPTLNTKVLVRTFVLKQNFRKIHIEFSEAKFKIRAHPEKHYAWIKNVYFSEYFSSFGNYKNYPSDLSFLPQKPFDYMQQINHNLLSKEFNVSVPSTYYKYLVEHNEKYYPLVKTYKMKYNIPLITEDNFDHESIQYLFKL